MSAMSKNKQRQMQRQQQIPCGNDSKKSNGNSRFPAGMTARKAKATLHPLWNCFIA
jgi:hypothetical protein